MNTEKQILPEVQEYIDFSIQKLTDPDFFDSVIEKIKDRFMEYYLKTDRNKLLNDMRTKANKGAIEHGQLPETYEAIENELTNEYIDVVMYSMMHLFSFEKQLKESGKELPQVQWDNKEAGVRIVSVQSETIKDKTYFVKVDSVTSSAFECLCPSFMFNNPTKRACKHIRNFNAENNMIQKRRKHAA